jgi:hypothetical protein
MTDEPTAEDVLLTSLPRISRTITTNDGVVMVPAQWVRDIATIYDITAETGLAQEDRDEQARYMQHVRTISQAVTTVLNRDARATGPA